MVAATEHTSRLAKAARDKGVPIAACRASVIDSFSHGWRTIVPEECVGDVDQAPHDANLLDIRRRYADVLPLQEVMAYIENLI